MPTQTLTVQGDFSNLKHALPFENPNMVPPDAGALHYYVANKYNATTGLLKDCFGDSDFSPVPTYGFPTLNSSSSYPSNRLMMTWPAAPNPRKAIKANFSTNAYQFTIHAQYLYTGSVQNHALFSFISQDMKKVIRFQIQSGVDSKAHFQTHISSIPYVPLASNSLTAYKDAPLTFTPAALTKEILALAIDGTPGTGGSAKISRNGVLIDTLTNIGEFTLNGSMYLGNDIFSGSVNSDLKGIVGAFMVYEKIQTQEKIAETAAFLTSAFAS